MSIDFTVFKINFVSPADVPVFLSHFIAPVESFLSIRVYLAKLVSRAKASLHGGVFVLSSKRALFLWKCTQAFLRASQSDGR